MSHEYVFRGEQKPFAPDPEDERAREAARREAEALVNKPRPNRAPLPHDAELEEKVGEYQVGGLDAFGAEAEAPELEGTATPNQAPTDDRGRESLNQSR